MMIQTVFFDMGGTIDKYWYTPEMRLQETPALQQLLSSNGIILNLSDQALYRLVIDGLARYHQWRLGCHDELPPNQVWREYILKEYTDEFPTLDGIGENLMAWIETHYYQRQMRAEIPKVLETIYQQGYKIGLISNVNSRGQVPLNLKQYGIIQYFNPIVLSSEYKRRKPDPSIFHHAARLSNTPTSECIYIGDRIARDIVGAKRAGFGMAIQIQHDFNHGEDDDGADPDLIIKNMTELLEILSSVSQDEVNKRKEKVSSRDIKAILFDADGVLYFRKDKNQEYKIICKELNIPRKNVPETEIHHYRHLASIGQITFEQYKEEILRRLGVSDPAMIARGIQISQQLSDAVHYFNGIAETLMKLKSRDLYLGIVTDTAHPLHLKINKLEQGGFGNLWDTIISSYEVGIQKPDPRIYQLALRQLNLAPQQAVFVGHKAEELEGAKKVGMLTIAINYDACAKADFYIEEFTNLAKLPLLN